MTGYSEAMMKKGTQELCQGLLVGRLVAVSDPIILVAIGDPVILVAVGDPVILVAISDPVILVAIGDPVILAATGKGISQQGIDHGTSLFLTCCLGAQKFESIL